LKANKNMYLNINSEATTKGYLSVAVPGTVLGLDTALQKYGTMTRKQVMKPAIELARNGYLLTASDKKLLDIYANDFREKSNIAHIFLNKNKLLIQKNLANTLENIANLGPEYFYKGPIAQKIVEASQKENGILTLEDFKNYNIEILEPITCSYHSYTVISAPPPSSGGITLCEMLNILENFSLKTSDYQSSANIHDIADSMYYGFRDRNLELGDPDFVKNPVDKLISKSYAKELSNQIKLSSIIPKSQNITQSAEAMDTTHYSIIDKYGNAVAVTYTLNGFFGARVIASDTGFFLNDEMDDFATRPGSANKFGLIQYTKNNIQPGKRPLSSMTPTIIMKKGKVYMILGSPGGPRIITSVLLTILNVIDYGMNIQQAVDAPRFHSQGDNIIYTEPFAFSFITKNKLKYMGYSIQPQHTWSAVEAILINPSNHIIYGANDRRRPSGKALGY
jgi:gamma-glutamyltranspeptidase/glutathione hydrolase